MKRLLTGDCCDDNVYHLVDPTLFIEADFEAEVVKVLSCLHPDYFCGVFAGTFLLEGERRTADLALLHKSLSHWFVVEVELAGHSLEHHVLPQVRCLRYGEPEQSCATSLIRAFRGMGTEQADSILRYIPRFVAVVSNISDPTWMTALNAIDAQFLTVFVFRNRNGRTAHEIDGKLIVRTESLGFACFSEIDNCLRIQKGCGLPIGNIQIVDQFGNLGDWTVQESEGVLWIRKDRGPALLTHNSYIQIIRTYDGCISLRPAFY